MPEEVESQALAVTRAGDEPWHVSDHELGLPCLGHAQVRDQGGERVVRDLRPGRRQHGDQRGLARVREADQARVRHRLELEHQGLRDAGLAAERETGGLAPGRCERRIPETAVAALGGDEPGARADQVGERGPVLGLDHGAVRDPQHEILAFGAAAVRTCAGLAAARPPEWPAVEIQQRRRAGIDLDDHIAAAAAVAPVRAAEWLELFPVDRGAAVAAITRLHSYLSLISELSHCRTSSAPSCAAVRNVRAAVPERLCCRPGTVVLPRRCGGGRQTRRGRAGNPVRPQGNAW